MALLLVLQHHNLTLVVAWQATEKAERQADVK